MGNSSSEQSTNQNTTRPSISRPNNNRNNGTQIGANTEQIPSELNLSESTDSSSENNDHEYPQLASNNNQDGNFR